MAGRDLCVRVGRRRHLAAWTVLCLALFGAPPVRAAVSQLSFSSSDPNSGPQVNSNGLVAWNSISNPSTPVVLLWNNGTTQQLGNTTQFDSQPNFSLSNSGEAVYQYEVNPPVGQDAVAGSEIFLWNGTSSSQLSPHTTGEGHIYPVINSSNQAAWVHVYYPSGNQGKLSFDVQFWNGSLTAVSSSYVLKTNLHVNDNGWVVWQEVDTVNQTQLNQIYLWNGMSAQRLSDGTADSVNPQINNNNRVVWQEFDTTPNQPGTNHYEVY